jgi:hypothetical protein
MTNCDENITYILKKKRKLINSLLIKSDTDYAFKGYRFIDSDDLTETIRTEQWFKGINKNIGIEFIFIRHYIARDLSFNPLLFSEWKTTVIAKHLFSDAVIVYSTKKALMEFIKSFDIN